MPLMGPPFLACFSLESFAAAPDFFPLKIIRFERFLINCCVLCKISITCGEQHIICRTVIHQLCWKLLQLNKIDLDLKGTFQQVVRPPFVFIIWICLCHWPIGNLNFKFKKADFFGSWYPGEIDSPRYDHTDPRKSCFGGFFIDPLCKILRRDWLDGVSYPKEIDSPWYHTPGRLKNLNNLANSEPKSKIL